VFPTLADHNLRQLLDAGLLVTVNSDDPAYFGGYVNRNYVECFSALPLDAGHAYRLARAGFEASFCDPGERAARIDEVDRFFARA
jgi:adenosine deaminase